MKKNQLFWLMAIFILFFGAFRLVNQAGAATEPYITVNKNQMQTNVRKVTLQLYGPVKTTQMMVSNFPDFIDAVWEPYKTTKTWYLQYIKGTQTVYVKFKDK
ncbi:MAG: hypothetical protein HZC26_04050 [Candidatus Magasanikbacteria bacterium]|nr:hypothetical protein [Candidatus Magasanikbacteria bacterium]